MKYVCYASLHCRFSGYRNGFSFVCLLSLCIVVRSRYLLFTVCLCRNLQEKLVEVLRGVMQQKPADQWKFEQFIPFCEKMISNFKIHVFCVVSGTYHIIYLPGNCR